METLLHRMGASAVAVDDQSIARVCFELSQHAPKMHELGRCLVGIQAHSDEQRAQLASFCTPLRSLLEQLDQMSVQPQEGLIEPAFPPPLVSPSLESTLGLATRRSTAPPNTYERPTNILPPSPEKRQKRKDSYSYH
jgi:hypothetical protein